MRRGSFYYIDRLHLQVAEKERHNLEIKYNKQIKFQKRWKTGYEKEANIVPNAEFKINSFPQI